MDFPRASDRSRPAQCEIGDQSFGTRRCQSSPYAAAKGETRVEHDEGSTNREKRHEETTVFRAVAARVNYLARQYVRHHETVLKDVAAGRRRLEEHEKSESVLRWKATSWVSV